MVINFKNSFFLLHMLFISLNHLYTQPNSIQKGAYAQVSISSPTAASLAKFADIPVNFHTGIPDINIPIYTITEGALSLPISMNYHASGIKVEEPAAWVGAGWSLNAGGVITRTVRGTPDEANTSNASKGHFSNYGFSNYLTELQSGGYPIAFGSTAPNDASFKNGLYDGEPDIFFFNFGAYAGKFYFNDDRMPILVAGEDIKFQYYFPQDQAASYTSESSNIQGFIATIPNGDKYYFGINADSDLTGASPIEITFPFSASHENVTERVYSSWFLSKIESADGVHKIKLEYQNENFSYYTLSTFPIKADFQANQLEYELVKNNIQGVRLTRITFSNGQIDFSPTTSARIDLGRYVNGEGLSDLVNTNSKALDNISIFDNNGYCKKFKFSYSYFSDNLSSLPSGIPYTIETDKKRLKLDSLSEQSCDGATTIPPYKFNYYANFLPRRLSFSVDHWGFYNGKINTTLIPTYSEDTYTFFDGADRDSKWPEVKNGSLTKIIYPTGGYDSLEFESNTTWVTATKYEKQQRFNFTSNYGGTGSGTMTYQNIPFTGNRYKISISNDACTYPETACPASVSILSSTGTVLQSVSAIGGSTGTAIIVVSPGNYTVQITRDNNHTGSGANAIFFEIVPISINNNVTVGGLRISKRIKNDVITTNNIITAYSYDVNSKSTGILYSRPTYVQTIRNDFLALEGYPGNATTVNLQPHGCISVEGYRQIYFKSPCGIIPMSTSQGNHIGYEEVKVSEGTANGFSIYRYYGSYMWDLNHDDVCYRNIAPLDCSFGIPNFPPAPLPYEYKRGLLKYEGHFIETGSRIKEIHYSYDFDSTAITTPAYIVRDVFGGTFGTQYELKGYWKKNIKTIQFDCDQSNNCVTSEKIFYYESPIHHQVTREKSTSSTQNVVETIMKYSSDFSIPNCSNISDGLTDFLKDCKICDSNLLSQLLSYQRRDYRCMVRIDHIVCKAAARKKFITYRRTNFTDATNNFSIQHQTAKDGADGELKPILELQDQYQNPVIETSTYRNNNLVSASFNRFDYGMNSSAFVYPKTLQTIYPSTLSATFTDAATSSSGSSVTKDSRYSTEASYQYKNGNPVEVTGKDGQITSYIWGYNNSLPIVKAVGVDAVTLNTAYTAVNGNLTQLRSYSSLSNALISSYTYSPLLGIAIATDPSGKTISYEYDKLGRLYIVKDQGGYIIKKNEYKYAGQ